MSSHLYGSIGVGRLLGETYSLFFRRILIFMVPVIAASIISGIALFILRRVAGGNVVSQVLIGNVEPADIVLFAAIGLATGILYLAVMGVISLLTIDMKRGQRLPMAYYFRRALNSVPMLIILGLVLATLFLGSILFLSFIAGLFSDPDLAGFLTFLVVTVATLYIAVKLAPIIPIVVHERAGLGSFRRSFELTQGYFFPVLGLVLVNIFIVFLISFAIAALVGFFGLALLSGGVENAVTAFQVINIMTSLLSGIFSYLVPVILSTLIYMRLREIKEGITDDDVATVFE